MFTTKTYVTLRDFGVKWATLEEEKEVAFGTESMRGYHGYRPKERRRFGHVGRSKRPAIHDAPPAVLLNVQEQSGTRTAEKRREKAVILAETFHEPPAKKRATTKRRCWLHCVVVRHDA